MSYIYSYNIYILINIIVVLLIPCYYIFYPDKVTLSSTEVIV